MKKIIFSFAIVSYFCDVQSMELPVFFEDQSSEEWNWEKVLEYSESGRDSEIPTVKDELSGYYTFPGEVDHWNEAHSIIFKELGEAVDCWKVLARAQQGDKKAFEVIKTIYEQKLVLDLPSAIVFNIHNFVDPEMKAYFCQQEDINRMIASL